MYNVWRADVFISEKEVLVDSDVLLAILLSVSHLFLHCLLVDPCIVRSEHMKHVAILRHCFWLASFNGIERSGQTCSHLWIQAAQYRLLSI